MDQSERADIENIMSEAPADHEQAVEFWFSVFKRFYGIGYYHGLLNKEVPHENPLPIPAADNR